MNSRLTRSATVLALLLTTACSTVSQPKRHPGHQVRFDTELGAFVIELEDRAAPMTCANFLRYVDAGRYDGGRFHRSVRLDNQSRSDIQIEVIQGGAVRKRDQPSFPPLALERTRDTGLRHLDGTVSMARGAPDSARSDFFICVGPQASLDFGGARNADGQGFAAFGRVVEGMDVIRAIHKAPTRGERLTPPIAIQAAARVAR